MLYMLSLDILYTSARGARVGGERWRGRRWTSRNNGYVLLLRPPEARRGLAPFVQSLGSQGLPGICGCDATRSSVCEASLSAAVSRTEVRGEPQIVWSRG